MEKQKIKDALWDGDVKFLNKNKDEFEVTQTIGSTDIYSLEEEPIEDRLFNLMSSLRELCKKGDVNVSSVWVVKDNDGLVRYFALLHNGSNGKENCVLEPMMDIADVIKGLKPESQYVNLAGASFDVCDDVYDWLLTLC